ncbi:hypothetical protein BJ508DRAFT_127995 [Ascobolus immersus RN42]|uniref:Fungal N-terminal domain-containing protein n=1 Tax=Ascobolus immersus RN42 TaxID=1160509 RepID=A0A3N4I768_ASCIM|nr:hypothetical protein BJ508DRAFT_127995 [Ascobolus immersus RN42]
MSLGFGVGDFIAGGQLVVKLVQALKDGDATIERFKYLSRNIDQLEESLVLSQNTNGGIEISASSLRGEKAQQIRDGLANMSEALGSAQESIIRFRREMEKYSLVVEVGGSVSSARSAALPTTKGLKRWKEKIGSVYQKTQISGDMHTAVGAFETELSLSIRAYKMNHELVKRCVS